MKRLIDCSASDLLSMSKQDKLDAILASEGRVSVQELSLFGGHSLIDGISDPELACAFGADMILLNAFDVYNPHVANIEGEGEEVVKILKKYTGRLLGINLEPVSDDPVLGQRYEVCEGRRASVETAKKAVELGFDFILLTGNPETGVTNEKIIEVMKEINEAVGQELIIMAGKMHAAGSKEEGGEHIITKDNVEDFVAAGADVVLLPAPGTVPGISLEYATKIVHKVHKCGALALSAIGTSQEGASVETIRQIALMCKMMGVDIHHIGDAGVGGMDPISLFEYNIAIKGKRHTYKRMARSVNR